MPPDACSLSDLLLQTRIQQDEFTMDVHRNISLLRDSPLWYPNAAIHFILQVSDDYSFVSIPKLCTRVFYTNIGQCCRGGNSL